MWCENPGATTRAVLTIREQIIPVDAVVKKIKNTVSPDLSLPPLMIARVLGQKHFAVIYGFLNIFTTLGTAVGVPLSGFIYDYTKSYHMAFALYIVLCIIAALAGIAVMAQAKKRNGAVAQA